MDDGCCEMDTVYRHDDQCTWESSTSTQIHVRELLDKGVIPHTSFNRQDTRAPSAQRIEAIVTDFLEQVATAIPSTEREIEQALLKKTRAARKLELRLADRAKVSNDGTRAQVFPRGMGASIIPFARFFRVADLAHEAILDGLPATKRDIFYRDVPLFKKQRVVDKLVDDLAATIDTGRAYLNVRASPKGLICGSGLSIHTVSGNVIHITESEGTLIPAAEDILSLEVPNSVNWVLIVEKEAVFQTLRQLCFTRHPFWRLGIGIMITGKGYPDLATRQLVKMLSENLPYTVPVVALVDGDAYGLDIVSVYKFGSLALRHEADKLAVPRVECIGIWTSELASFGIGKDALIPISHADEKKAHSMLRRELPARWKRELVHMLFIRRKAETEILSNVPRRTDEPHPLALYLAGRIGERRVALAEW
ncbi:DNA topoisomerase IV alpha subunit [Russula earlei]|uniref:DNA topoisomerase IV alpha subunit n=1 Tax=Russula earlei TaxID=71964 RepID=A0ACC0UC44_9AGAM|nr:DNA topoisomerase IV alpha subunit [Russula earlei]